MEIKIFGPGCARCHKTEALVREAVDETGIDATIITITDVMEIATQGVFGTPAVVIDGDVKCVGKIPKKKEIIQWLSR